METAVVGFLLIAMRTTGFVGALPVFGDRTVPRMVRVGLSMSLAWMWSHHAIDPVQAAALADNTVLMVVAVIREALLGVFLGFVFGLFLLPARVAGSYIAQEMGLSMASITNPESFDSSNVLSELLIVFGSLIFLSMDIHHHLLALLDTSFARWPSGSPLPQSTLPMMCAGLDAAHEQGLLIAAPIGIWLFVSTVGLLLLGKASPQINLFSIGLTLRIFVGVIACVVFFPETIGLVTRMMAGLRDSLGYVFQ